MARRIYDRSIGRDELWVPIAAVLILVIIALAGCGKADAPTSAAPLPPKVSVAKPIVQDVVEQDEYSGRLMSTEAVDVRARVGGYVDSIHFEDGQLVKKGDLLYVIDPRPYKAALDVAEGEVQQAQSNLDLAISDFERVKGLVKARAISQEDFDTRSKRSEAAAANLQAAKARATRARLDLEFTEVRAPMSGRIARHLVSVGNLIAGGSSDSTVLTNIVSVDPIYAYFDIDEQAYLKYLRLSGSDAMSKVFKSSSKVAMALLGESTFDHTGELNFVDNQIDSATGTLRARAVFQNKDLNLSPGVFVKVSLPGSQPRKAVLLPDRAMQADQTDRFVLTVGKDNVVVQKKVTLGRIYDGLRIVTSGLDGSESVIIDGIQRARPGSAVNPEQKSISLASATTRPANDVVSLGSVSTNGGDR